MTITLQQLAQDLDGEISNGQVLAPGPDHSPNDRSMAVVPSDTAPEGFVVFSFSDDDINECRDHVRAKLGMPAFEPRRRANSRVNGKPAVAAKDYKGSPEMEAMLAANAAAIKATKRQQPTTRGRITKVYDYVNHGGVLQFQVLRYEPKNFSQRRPDPDNPGRWINNLQGVVRVPYRLPDVLQHPDTTLFVCEGEKDTDNCAALGLCATTVAGSKWTESCIRALTGREKPFADDDDRFGARDIVILQHNDDAGTKKALAAARALHGYVKTLRIVLLPGLPANGGDLTDWLEDTGAVPRHDKALLIKICLEAPEWVPDHPTGETSNPEPALTDTEGDDADDELQAPEYSDEALALRFAERYAGNLRYVAFRAKWLSWISYRWVLDETLSAFSRARLIARAAAAECDQPRTASALASAKTVAAIERLAKADQRLAATSHQWDADPDAFNTPKQEDGT